MTTFDETQHPRETTGKFAEKQHSAPAGVLGAAPEQESVEAAKSVLRGDRLVTVEWDDETDSEVVLTRRITRVNRQTRLEDYGMNVEFELDDGTTTGIYDGKTGVSVIRDPNRTPGARTPEELGRAYRDVSRRIRRHGPTREDVDAALEIAEDPGRERDVDARSFNLADQLEYHGGHDEEVARLRAAARGI